MKLLALAGSEGAHREVVERPVPFVDVLITPQLNGHSCKESRDTVIHDSQVEPSTHTLRLGTHTRTHAHTHTHTHTHMLRLGTQAWNTHTHTSSGLEHTIFIIM